VKRAFGSSAVFWLLGLPAVLALTFLTVVGSRLLINPTAIDISPCGDVIVFRDYPMVDLLGVNYPIVRYITTITPLTPGFHDGYVCREDNGLGQRYNHDHGRGFGRWSIKNYAEPCMEDPIGFRIDIQYTALLFDLIPLRPISISAVATKTSDGWVCPGSRGPQGPQGERGEPGLNWWERP
jgi:hypothetical protein